MRSVYTYKMKNSLILLAVILCAFTGSSVASAQEPTMCTMQYQPVCGTEKGVYKTYGNSCVMGTSGATYQHEGECTSAELAGRQEGTYTPPAHCTSWNDGCNSCGRSAGGQAFCTLMACMGEPRAGYCIAYGDTVTNDPGPAPDRVVSSPVTRSEPASEEPIDTEAATDTASTTSENPGFLTRAWTQITSWFSDLFKSLFSGTV